MSGVRYREEIMQRSSARYENLLIVLMFLTFGTIFLDRMAQFYLAPYLIPDLHVNNIQIGMMASALALAWAIASLVFGGICDRYGYRVVLIPAVFVFSLMSWLTGVVQTFGEMLLVRFLLGLAEGACYAPVMAISEASSSGHRRGLNVGFVVSAAGFVGTGIAPILTTQVAAAIGWRWSFFVAGIPGIILGLFLWKYVQEPRREGLKQRPNLKDLASVVKYRNVVLCCLTAAANLTALMLVGIFAPLFITQVMHEDPRVAGFIISAMGVGGTIAAILLPWISDRMGRKPILLIAIAGSVIVPLLFLVPSLYQHIWLFMLLELVLATGTVVPVLAMVVVPTETVPATIAATAIGATTLTAEVIGATIAPTIGGIIAQTHGLAITLYIAAAVNVVAFLLILFVRETHRAAVPRLTGAPAV
ncbi:MAG TPA: MFS transporter [Stellaceae bacterium]|nr:MFS transporter [Stellaceae bacterium]